MKFGAAMCSLASICFAAAGVLGLYSNVNALVVSLNFIAAATNAFAAGFLWSIR